MIDYKKILDAVKSFNPHAEIIFTGGEPLISLLTIPVARYAKTLGFSCKLMTNATLIDLNINRTLAAIELLDKFSADPLFPVGVYT